MKIRFVRHPTLEHIVKATIHNVDEMVFDARHVRDSRRRGLAAYSMHLADGKGGVVHYWFAKRVPLLKRLEVLAHEVGHLTGLGLLHPVLEEKRADDYSRAATRAYKEAIRK